MTLLSENFRMDNPQAAALYNQTFNKALSQGNNYEEASQLATSSLYATLQSQSLLLGIKTMLGYMLIAALVLAIASRFIPFHKTLKVAIVKTGEDMV